MAFLFFYFFFLYGFHNLEWRWVDFALRYIDHVMKKDNGGFEKDASGTRNGVATLQGSL